MVDQKPCRIAVCTSCKCRETGTRPGAALVSDLRQRLAALPDLDALFKVSAVACMAGCDRPCTVGFHGVGKASYLFGDIASPQDAADLLTFANLYALIDDGWCSSVDRPGKLRKSTLARIPATLFATPAETQAAP